MAVQNPGEPFTRIDVKEAQEKLDKGEVALIDVREPVEFAAGRLPGATLIPVNSIPARKDELPQSKPILFVCATGQRSALAAEFAAAFGHKELYNLEGGTVAWREAGLPIEQ
ncbi:MAG: rhodanese-like domain-containing protein [Dehalococcoidia bacterium]